MNGLSLQAVERVALEELIYETVHHDSKLWETTQYAQSLVERIERIERTKVDCADTAEEQAWLVEVYANRAWARLAEAQDQGGA